MKQLKFPLLAIALIGSVISCKKVDDPSPEIPKVTAGAYVLNEGSFNGNNTSLTYYDYASAKAITDFYQNQNGSGLGDTGNDMIIYGGKLYIVMNVSSYLEVADASNAKSIKKIDLKSASAKPLTPRYVIGYKNKVMVSCWDGTVAVIDTTSLAIDKFIKVGANPEQMAIVGTNLYVANSGGITPGFDSTLSVVDLNTLTEKIKIKVGKNPGPIAADDAGNIYVGCSGDYGSNVPSLVKVNASTNMVTKSADTAVGKIRYFNNALYVTGVYGGSPYIRTLNTTDFSATSANFVTDGTVIKTAYGLDIDESNGDVYVGDALDYSSAGQVFCFDKGGKKKFSFSVAPGINPNKILFIRK